MYLPKIETWCRTVKQYLHQLKDPNYELRITFRIRTDFFFQSIGKNVVLNLDSSKKKKKTTRACEIKRYPIKLFVIVIIHQSK